MALDSAHYSVNVQRAALNFVTALCDKLEMPRTTLLATMDGLLYSLLNPVSDFTDSLLKAKVRGTSVLVYYIHVLRLLLVVRAAVLRDAVIYLWCD